MSAPEPDLEIQRKRHIGPLAGIALAVAVVLVGFVVFYGDVSDPDESATPATATAS